MRYSYSHIFNLPLQYFEYKDQELENWDIQGSRMYAALSNLMADQNGALNSPVQLYLLCGFVNLGTLHFRDGQRDTVSLEGPLSSGEC